MNNDLTMQPAISSQHRFLPRDATHSTEHRAVMPQ